MLRDSFARTSLLQESPELIGSSAQRIDMPQKVTGGAVYTRDRVAPRMLYARIKRCPFPHAKIVNIDTKRATELAGFKGVITGKDFPILYSEDTPALAYEEVLYSGQGVVAVAAEDRLTAHLVADAVEVEYEQLPALLDAELAMSPQAPVQIKHPGERTEAPNVGRHLKVVRGDIEGALRDADRVIENTYATAIESHFQLEPLTFLVSPDPDGGVTIWATTSGPHKSQVELSRYLGIDPHLVRVKIGYLGGWFGEKEEGHVAAACAMLALKTRRPVKLELSREETMIASGVRHPAVITVTDGFTNDGRLIARKIRAVYDGGAYGSTGNAIVRNSILAAVSVYDVPNLRVDSYRVYTNRVPGTAKPATMGPQMVWAIESQMEYAASVLRLDPIEIRLKNILRDGSENAVGEVMHSIDYERCLQEVSRLIQLGRKSAPDGPWRCGKGIALGAKWSSGGLAQAFVRFRETGKVEVFVNVVENGQGIYTAVAQIVASEFGIPISDAVLSPMLYGADSVLAGVTEGASGSRQLVYSGKAVLLACRKVKERIAESASRILRVPASEVEVKGRYAYARNDPERRVAIAELFATTELHSQKVHYSEGPAFEAQVTYSLRSGALDPATGRCKGGPASPYYVTVAQGAEVWVNIETGQVRVRRVVAAMDVGKAINPELIKGQIRGSVMMGVSATLSEELIFSHGRIVNANLADYKILTTMDAPDIMPLIVEIPYKEGPYGAKGAGNPSIMPTAPAIRNALHDAVGVWINEMPITPERVLDSLHQSLSEPLQARVG